MKKAATAINSNNDKEIEKLLHLLLASCQTVFLSSLRLCTNKL